MTQVRIVLSHSHCFLRNLQLKTAHNANVELVKSRWLLEGSKAEIELENLLREHPGWMDVYYKAVRNPEQLTEARADAAKRMDVCRRYAMS